ncbi:hypothetical protein EYF80_017236 [Liparis tanakae]|uniref:Uncharacterized protein n=1 Tax=Liparis tanakae TaxID=230148 RepID=A0A4Z2I3R4_9TELE|nr:hypothetical protein EYF80_017236 [Liparis tanakae]
MPWVASTSASGPGAVLHLTGSEAVPLQGGGHTRLHILTWLRINKHIQHHRCIHNHTNYRPFTHHTAIPMLSVNMQMFSTVALQDEGLCCGVG